MCPAIQIHPEYVWNMSGIFLEYVLKGSDDGNCHSTQNPSYVDDLDIENFQKFFQKKTPKNP